MANISLSFYSLSFRNKETNEDLILNPNHGENIFNNILEMFRNQYSNEYDNNENLERLFKIENFTDELYEENGQPLFRQIICKVKSGKYGIESEIVNSQTGEVTYRRTETDADVMPFYFAIGIPVNETNRALVVFQNNGIYGIKTVFTNAMKTICVENGNTYCCDVRNIIPREYINRFLENGILKKIRFIRYNIPNDRAERMGLNLGVNGENMPYEEYVVHRPLGFMDRNRRRIGEFVDGQRGINRVVEMEGFEYNNIKLEFKLGGKSKTLDLSGLDKVVVSEDITNEVDTIGGHPTEHSILPVISENLKIYLEGMGII